MAMKIEDIKKKLAAMESGKPKKAKWKPTGEHTVRVLPLPGEEDIGLVVKWHYNVDNGRQMYCPTTHGDSCPFCEFAQTLKGWKDSNGVDKSESQRKMDWEAFKALDAAVKHYVPMVERKKDAKDGEVDGPFLWEMTPKTYTALFKIIANDDWNEDHPEGGGLKVITSLTHALDLVVTLKKPGVGGNTTSFQLTEVEERKKFSALFKNDLKAAQALLERIPNIEEIGKPISTAEAVLVFNAYSASMKNDNGNDKSGVEHGGETTKTYSTETLASGGDSVDDVVAKLSKMVSKG